jgi:late competence protein required for DNA uptake (superfamily II DNA/RNA helicase)
MRYLILILLLSSCSANWHLKRAVKKGAKVKQDTVYVTLTTERIITDTITEYKNLTDTIFTETIKWKSKILIDTVKQTIYQEIECKPDTIKIPVQVNTEIKPDKNSGYKILIWMLIGAVLVLIVLFILKK